METQNSLRTELPAAVREQLARDGFAIAAMAQVHTDDPAPFFDGQSVPAAGLLCCTGNPDEFFAQDALRILQAVRFAAQLGLDIEPAARAAMLRSAPRLDMVPAGQAGTELRQILCAPFAARAVEEHRELLCRIVPELADLIGCSQNNRYHKADVFGHTVMALRGAEECWEFPREWADEPVRIALFFHDFGKPLAKTTDSAGHDHFYGHPVQSAELTEGILRRLRFPDAETETITTLVRYHDIEYSPTRARVRRMLNQFGTEQLLRLLKIRECDNAAHSALARPKFETTVLPFAALIEEVLAEQDALTLRDLAISGRDLLPLGLQPGPQVGQLLRTLLDEVAGERLPNERQALLTAARTLLKNMSP